MPLPWFIVAHAVDPLIVHCPRRRRRHYNAVF